jgi:hypothetical protein
MAGENTADLGPRERRNHGLGVEVGARIATEGGIVIHEGAKARAECVLDAMLELGILDGVEGGKDDRRAVGRTRHMAGMRYRRTFESAGLNQVQAMDVTIRAQAGSGQIPDAVASSLKKFNSTTSRLGAFKAVAMNVCCFNSAPNSQSIVSALKRALDRLCEDYQL